MTFILGGPFFYLGQGFKGVPWGLPSTLIRVFGGWGSHGICLYLSQGCRGVFVDLSVHVHMLVGATTILEID